MRTSPELTVVGAYYVLFYSPLEKNEMKPSVTIFVGPCIYFPPSIFFDRESLFLGRSIVCCRGLRVTVVSLVSKLVNKIDP